MMTNYDQYWVGEASRLIRQPGLPLPTTPEPQVVSRKSVLTTQNAHWPQISASTEIMLCHFTFSMSVLF